MLGQWWRGGDNSPVGTGHPGRGGAGRITEVRPQHWAGSTALYCARLGLSSEQGRHTKRNQCGPTRDQQQGARIKYEDGGNWNHFYVLKVANVSSSSIFHSHLPRIFLLVACPLSVSGILNRFPFTARRLTRSWGERGFAGLCITISISIRLVQRKSQKYCCTFLPLTDQLYSFTWSIKVENQIRVEDKSIHHSTSHQPGHRYICFCAAD